jgi:hypothetical protein
MTTPDAPKGAPVIGIIACVAGVIGAGAGAYGAAVLMPEYDRASQAHLDAIKTKRGNDEAEFQAWVDAKDAATPFGFVSFGFGGLALLLAIVGLVKKQTVPSILGLILGIAALVAGVMIVPAM